MTSRPPGPMQSCLPDGLLAAAHLFTDSQAKFGGGPGGDQHGSMAGEQAPCVRSGSGARPDGAKSEARPLEFLPEAGQVAANSLVSHCLNLRSSSARSISW